MCREPAAYLALLALTLTTFWPVLADDFVNYDDPVYVTKNAHVQSGITTANVHWAFTTTDASNWHPLTWLSHSLDCQLFGLNPRWHHTVNLAFHVANALLLLLALQQMTGRLWRGFVVAALFAIHPLHVESVAWVAERKDVLSVFFGLLTILAYLGYVRRQTAGRYLLTLTLFGLGLMAKPMLVTMPFVLLLLDFWPLGRFARKIPEGTKNNVSSASQAKSTRQLLVEKIPFLVLTVISCVITYRAQHRGGAMEPWDLLPLGERVQNAMASYATYLGKMFWPVNLAVFYPFHPLPVWKVMLSALILLSVSAFSILKARSWPWLFVGWFWFLVMLVPVIGIIQVGAQAMADRYSYFALTGPFIIVCWGAAETARGFKWPRTGISLGIAGVITACVFATRLQLGHWQNSISLFTHAVTATSENAVAENNLGSALLDEMRLAKAEPHFRSALAIRPKYPNAHFNLGLLLEKQGETNQAEDQFRAAIENSPGYVLAHKALGTVLFSARRYDEAENHFRTGLAHEPTDTEMRKELGLTLALEQKNDEAESEFQEVLRQTPDDPAARQNLGNVLAAKGDLAGAVAEYSKALELSRTNSLLRENLAKLLVQSGQAEKATELLRDGLKIQPTAGIYSMLASLSLRSSNAVDAVTLYRSALQLKPDAVGILNNFSWILATSPDEKIRDGAEAVEMAEKACRLSQYKQPMFLGTLAAAYAEAGRFPDAIATAQKACDVASAAGNTELLKKNQELLELYRAGRAYRESAP